MEQELFCVLRDIIEKQSTDQDISSAIASGYIQKANGKYHATESGMLAMQPYRVRRAIFMAAGIGSRISPLTYEVPKGLVQVKGKSMVERQIEQLLEAGIEDIWLVTGYLHEKYEELKQKYSIRTILNPQYASMNNIGTVYHARALFDQNLYLLCVDNLLEENIFHAYEYHSWYASPYVKGNTAEWCLDLDTDERITGITVGGQDSYIMMGPVYFTAGFAKTLTRHIEDRFGQPDTLDMYWEDIYMEYLDEMDLYANKQTGISREFESLEELREYDASYINDSGNAYMQEIAQALGIGEAGITGIIPAKHGLFSRRLEFSANGRKYLHINYSEDLGEFWNGKAQADSVFYVNLPKTRSALLSAGEERFSPVKTDREAMEILKQFHESKTASKATEKSILSYFEATVEQYPDAMQALAQTPQDERTRVHGMYCRDNCLVSGTQHVLAEDYFGGIADRLVDVGSYCAIEEKDEKEMLALYLMRMPTAEEVRRTQAYKAATSAILFYRYSRLQQKGIDCTNSVKKYNKLISK